MREGIFQVQGGRKDRKNKKPQGTLHKERDGPAGLLLQPFVLSGLGMAIALSIQSEGIHTAYTQIQGAQVRLFS